ncbi:MAG: hypothetical protein KGJ62_09810 [Armatimonadetes bacterium]|nr:hypothetical protein [Armatimonadota bacterium]MDE2207977.1 hypothetical protein [Armatimonadota bacterium]
MNRNATIIRIASCTAILCFAAAATAQRPPTLDPTFGLPIPKAAKPSQRISPQPDWIWAQHTRDNQTVWLRGTFQLHQRPQMALLRAAADNFLKVWVNGHAAAATTKDPPGGYAWQNASVVPVARWLRRGTNVVCIEGHNQEGSAGAVAVVESGSHNLLTTNSLWRATEEQPTSDWLSPSYPATNWTSSAVIAPLGGGPWSTGLSGWPGITDAPYLAHIWLPPVRVVQVHAGDGSITGAETVCRAGGQNLVIHLAPQGSKNPPSLVLDFGKELAGRLEITGSGTGVVQAGTGESLGEAMVKPWGGIHNLNTPARRAATPWSAWRFVRLVFVPQDAGGAGTLRLTRMSFNHKYYPVRYLGSFDCSDPLLTRIWYTGAYTAHLCMQEDIWDAPKRDRARWMGDLHVSGRVIDTVFLDRFLMEQTMDRLRSDAQGGLPYSDPPKSNVNGIPGYSCAWIGGMADLYRHTGDKRWLLKQHLPLLGMLTYLHGEMDADNLFVNAHHQWPFVDWSPGFDGDTPLARAATDLFIIYAARQAAFLLRAMGDPTNATRAAQWAHTLALAARAHLADPQSGVWGARRQENAMAVYSGAAVPADYGAIYTAAFAPTSPAWKEIATPYYDNYVLYAMSKLGHTRAALKFARAFWGGMLKEGATSFWEGYDLSWPKVHPHLHLGADDGVGYFVSLCHGWSSGVTSWLTECVLGIRPTGGGFSTAVIAPHLSGLHWAAGTVPTPHGPIHVRAVSLPHGLSLTVRLPVGVRADVSLPGSVLTMAGRRLKARMKAGRVNVTITGPCVRRFVTR